MNLSGKGRIQIIKLEMKGWVTGKCTEIQSILKKQLHANKMKNLKNVRDVKSSTTKDWTRKKHRNYEQTITSTEIKPW